MTKTYQFFRKHEISLINTFYEEQIGAYCENILVIKRQYRKQNTIGTDSLT